MSGSSGRGRQGVVPSGVASSISSSGRQRTRWSPSASGIPRPYRGMNSPQASTSGLSRHGRTAHGWLSSANRGSGTGRQMKSPRAASRRRLSGSGGPRDAHVRPTPGMPARESNVSHGTMAGGSGTSRRRDSRPVIRRHARRSTSLTRAHALVRTALLTSRQRRRSARSDSARTPQDDPPPDALPDLPATDVPVQWSVDSPDLRSDNLPDQSVVVLPDLQTDDLTSSQSRRTESSNTDDRRTVASDRAVADERRTSDVIDLTDIEGCDTSVVDLTSPTSSYGANDSSLIVIGQSGRAYSAAPLILSDTSDDDDELPEIEIPKRATPAPAPSTPPSSKSCDAQVESPQLQCPICMDDYKEIKLRKSRLASTTCGHVFCLECITSAVNTHKQCPICRTKLRQRSYHTLHV